MMSDLITAIPKGVTAFTATNLDDIVILLLLFSQVGSWFHRRHIVLGQYLGFTALVLLSLPGFFGAILFPQDWVGMLGIVPIAIGISRLLNREEESAEAPVIEDETTFSFTSLLSPQTCGVASITFANGGDNIGIYIPLFASCTWETLLLILVTFFSLVGVWCYTAYRLTKVPMIATTLTRYGSYCVPFVLMGLGVMVLLESHTLENRNLLFLSTLISGIIWIMLHRQTISIKLEKAFD